MSESNLAVFDEVRAEMAVYKAENEKLVFDYEDPQGNKDARSHVAKLRRVKTKIADVHKLAKAEALAVCQAIDGEKRLLIADMEEMIEVHAAPVREIEERKKAEIAAKAEAERLEAERIRREREEAILKQAEEVNRREAELKAKEAELKAKEDAIKAEEERKAREAQIVANAAVAARREAEAKAQAKIQAAENARLAKEAAEKAEQERLAAIEKARIEDQEHRSNVENGIVDQIAKLTGEDIAIQLVTVIAKGGIKNLTITY